MPPSPPQPTEPRGELVIRTIAMPADTNSNGDIFGGWLLSQMDLGGAVLARNVAHSRVVTVAIEGMSFLYPVFVGDIVTCYARRQSIGRTSMKIDLEAWVQRQTDGTLHRVTEGLFTYVAIDEGGRPHPVRRRGEGAAVGRAEPAAGRKAVIRSRRISHRPGNRRN